MFHNKEDNLQSRRQEMNSYNPIRNPENLAHMFSQYVKSLVLFLAWGTVALVSIAGAYLAVRIVWVAVKIVLKAIGIQGG